MLVFTAAGQADPRDEEEEELNLKIGLFGGLGTSQISNDGLTGYHRSGAVAGAFVSRQLTPHSEWQFELTYFQKGARDSINNIGRRVNEFTIPVVYRYSIGAVRFEAGLSADIHLNAVSKSNSGENDESDEYRAMGVSGLLGVNYHFTEKVWITFRVHNSIFPIQAGSVASGVGPNRLGNGWRHSVLSFGVYYSFL